MEKVLVLLSGGQDSATCLALASSLSKKVYTISFNYGQKHNIELLMAKRLSELARARRHLTQNIDMSNMVSGLLASSSIGIHTLHPQNQNLPSSFVPGRNYLFLGFAAAIAHGLGISHLMTGVCQTDYSGYPDCRDDTIKSINQSLILAMDYPFQIHTPLMFKTKAETVLLMEGLGKLDWYYFTHTCYEGQRPPCGECPACRLRAKGFVEAGMDDPLSRVSRLGEV